MHCTYNYYFRYSSYGYNNKEIGLLFVCGYFSSFLSGIFIGALADKAGRKRTCYLYSCFFTIGCTAVHFKNFDILMFGRVFTGISASILNTCFESWLVLEFSNVKETLLISSTRI